ncbi:MAG: hypothetical protein N3D10_00935 [Candidatus Micrarchaeota archaeon]|nr:hypothetical protein [Candidatus Micrarchaeota archaeon]
MIVKIGKNIFFIIIFLFFALGTVIGDCFEQVYQYSEPNLALNCQDLILENNQAQIVYISSNPTLLFIKNSSKPIENQEQIKTILDNSVIFESKFNTLVQELKQRTNELKVSKSAAEQKCLQYTGMDRYECYDKDSCLLAAFAVPQASIAVNSPGFIDAMLDFDKKRKKLNSSIENLSSLLSNPSPSLEYSKQLRAAVENLEQEIINYNSCNLMLDKTDPGCNVSGAKCFEYCPKILLPSKWIETKKELSSTSSTLEKLNSNSDLAKTLAKNTIDWLKFLEKRTVLWDELKRELNSLFQNINNSLSSKKFSDKALEESLNQSLNAYEQINSKIKNGEFFLAIEQGMSLKINLEQLSKQVSGYREKLNQIDRKLNTIQLSLKEIKQSENFDKFNQKFLELKNRTSSPVQANELDELLATSSELEEQVLLEVAKIKLKIKDQPSSQEKNTSNLSVEKKPEGLSSGSLLPTSFCPLASGFIGLIFIFIFFRKSQE